MKSLVFAGAAAGLVAAPIAAQSTLRTAAPVGDAEELDGGIGPAFIILALAGAGMAILLLTDDDDPQSP
ncbi:hypothetical protein ELI_08310 [Erythrobacter litoralis HTCC2594]|uniref:Uncharacterized protein n=2 Tax=Erythrobacter litoralis TaxID=39960 RepID=Q2N987_ERYLH|nr:hypothetical protein ELI_08310 [Erythrobacter litoralis HTCC2594]